jgi:hypothetical protein
LSKVRAITFARVLGTAVAGMLDEAVRNCIDGIARQPPLCHYRPMPQLVFSRYDHYWIILLWDVWFAVKVNKVTRAIRLGFEIETIVVVCGDDVWNAISNVDAVALKFLDLAGIVGEETD